MSKDGKPEDKGDHTDPFNPKNIKHLTSIDELPNDLHQKIEPKQAADLQAFLASCNKDRREKCKDRGG
jgi:hypothetical protein